ncbi:MAG TPA: methylated-DNA--[protein]-cysteine S-methyltransferase [Bryobacteraceae bacterium]|nr:methylated-DNA--[protein]-cysteine S-methyltransferase [Bryobacteraceae bacterium]
MYEWCDLEVRQGFSLSIETGPHGVRSIEFGAHGIHQLSSAVMRNTVRQLQAYFAGDLQSFDVPLEIGGTDFQRRVWNALQTIPYGQMRSYSQIAAQIGAPRAVRAVGAANGRNPIPIIVPCHRVIGASGSLVGFGGGLAWKRLLLDLEATYVERSREATA